MKNLDPYTLFPGIYDPIMEHIDFRAWTNFILASIEPHYPATLLDIGCGTGSLLREFPELSLKTGFDRSEKMLEIAKFRNPKCEFIKGDMTKFSINRKYDLILCTHDTLNYIINVYDLESHFSSVYSVLEEDGYYFFDISSEYNLKKNFHNQTIRETYGDTSVIWENVYNEVKKEIISTLTFQINSLNGTEYFQELHVQRYYPNEEIFRIADENGFEITRVGSDYKKWKLDPTCSLITFLAVKK